MAITPNNPYAPNTAYYANQPEFNTPLHQGFGLNQGSTTNIPSITQGEDITLASQTPQQRVPGSTNYMPYVAAGLGALQTGVEIAGDYRQTSKFDVDEATMQDRYNPYYQPPTFMKQETPQEIAEGTGKRAALNYAGKGFSTGFQAGMLTGNPLIALATGAGGAAIGAFTGAKKGQKAAELRAEWDQNQKDRFNKYLQADRIHGDVSGTMDRANEKAKSFSQRGMNTTPIYNSSIYGYMR